MKRRVAPAFVLFLLSPLVAEFLLGNFTLLQWPVFLFVAPIYGGGAVIIREFARRSGRGWPTMFLLALAYGLIEEGFATQSLFNPHYLGLHLLDYGFIPALGISTPWTVYVLALHVFWSIAVPIALVEALFPPTAESWLDKGGLSAFAVVYVVGVLLVRLGTARNDTFRSSASEQSIVAGLSSVLSVCALYLPLQSKAPRGVPPTVPPPRALGLIVLVVGSLFQLGYAHGIDRVPPFADTLALLGVIALFLGWLSVQSRSPEWTARHTAGVAAGGALVYGWSGFQMAVIRQGPGAWIWQFVPLGIVLGLIARISIRQRSAVSAS